MESLQKRADGSGDFGQTVLREAGWGSLDEIGGDFPCLGRVGKADKGYHTLLFHGWKSQPCPCCVPMWAALRAPSALSRELVHGSVFVMARAV